MMICRIVALVCVQRPGGLLVGVGGSGRARAKEDGGKGSEYVPFDRRSVSE